MLNNNLKCLEKWMNEMAKWMNDGQLSYWDQDDMDVWKKVSQYPVSTYILSLFQFTTFNKVA